MTQAPTDIQNLARLLKVIADETRLRILVVLAEEAATGKDLAERLALTAPTISHHMRKLTDARIVVAESDGQRQWYRLNGDLLLASKRVPLNDAAADTTLPTAVNVDAEEAFRAKVIRDFFVGDRLKGIPAQRKRRVIVLQHIMTRFDPDRTMKEAEVNATLRTVHDDFATLRRELVDYGYLQRDRGIYQVTRAAPERTKQIAQEITGDEGDWLRSLLNTAIQAQGSQSQNET
ncbi:MAG: metalloregulator ArsR/SmtB family transcription factor [Thermomicrobiales bacterium]